MKILVIAPHPDDEVIGCGGTILDHIKDGDSVSVVFVTNGGLLVTEGEDEKERHQVRRNEAKNACEILGVNQIYFMNQPERFLSYSKEVIKLAVEILRHETPDVIYLPHPDENDRDHRETYNIFKEAIWLACAPVFPEIPHHGSWHLKQILLYEVWTPMSKYQLNINIEKHMERKLEALRCYNSQLKDRRYDLAVKAFNFYRGVMGVGYRYAEVFKIASWSKGGKYENYNS